MIKAIFGKTMDTNTISLIALAIAAAVGAFFFIKARKKKAYYKGGKDIHVPAPASLRADLEYGYFTTYQNQVADVADHVTLHWQSFWEGEDKAIQDMKEAATRGLKIVLDLNVFLFENAKALRQNADEQVGNFFMRMAQEGVLHHVSVFTPMDEPNLPQNKSDHLIPAAVAIINKWRHLYSELTEGSKLGLVYYYMPPFRNLELFDIVGFDNYHSRSEIFAKGQQYEEFEKLLQPHQKTWVFAGASEGQSPEQFFNYAHANTRIWAVIAFLYADLPHPGIGLPLRDNPMLLEDYSRHGRAILATRLEAQAL